MPQLAKKSKVKSKSLSKQWQPVYLGAVLAVVFVFISWLPSLLPRPSWLQGLITGLSAIIGYGIGVALSSFLRWLTEYQPSKATRHMAWRLLYIMSTVFILLSFLLGVKWQNGVRELLQIEPIGVTYLLVSIPTSLIVFVIFYTIARQVRSLHLNISKRLRSKVPVRLAVSIGITVSVALVYFILSGVLARLFFKIADGMYYSRDKTAPVGVVQPTEGLRSGTPGAVISWDTIGFQGRGFIGSGPTKRQLEQYSGEPAKEPIRAYAGMQSAVTAEERAELAVQELKRTHAFDRKVLVIATVTGTGWLDPKVVDALEFTYNGDTAIVSQQYSYLPSWISFLVDKTRAKDAGVALYDAVMEEYLSLPEDQRPKLIAYGLSLGSFGGQEAFSSANDIRRSVDGAIFVGTPSASELWARITKSRDLGSPMWQPVINQGASLRFASSREDIIRNPEQWSDKTRVLYLQHANDPVVWFDFGLLLNKPDWLNEERGRNVSPATRWYPIITFLQVGLDQAIAASAPPENGHYYDDTAAYTWGFVLPPEGWTLQKSEALQKYLDTQFKSERSSIF